MPAYLGRRLVFFVLALVVVSLLAFFLSHSAPDDPVAAALRSGGSALPGGEWGGANSQRAYALKAAELGLDKPAFYFAIHPLAQSDTLHRIPSRQQREVLRQLAARFAPWPQVQTYYHKAQAANTAAWALSLNSPGIDALRQDLRQLLQSSEAGEIAALIAQSRRRASEDSLLRAALLPLLDEVSQAWEKLPAQGQPWQQYVPCLSWHGTDNQYHNWLAAILRLDFGRSYADGRPVGQKIAQALPWTLLLNFSALALAYLLAVPMGVFFARYPESRSARWLSSATFLLYALPAFWLASLLVMFFTSDYYSPWLHWFPNVGLGDPPSGAGFAIQARHAAPHLILPIICLTYNSLAILARHTRGSMMLQLGQDYIKTAFAKGLRPWRVYWLHALRNAALPLITLFAAAFPGLLAGSVIIEEIFNIPGMGRLILVAIEQHDWPVVFSVLLLSAVFTMLGIFLADLLYALADPRIRFDKRQNSTT